MTYYIDSRQERSVSNITRTFCSCIRRHSGSWSELVFLCIGSDRIIGDCLGPFVGQLLSTYTIPGISVYGTLKAPVHAQNLSSVAHIIRAEHPDSLVVAVDASLGQKKHLGYVTINNGSLYPGAAVHKELPPVGDIHITGIVNIAGVLAQLTLQTTRISTVISLADTIARGLLPVFSVSDPASDLRQIL